MNSVPYIGKEIIRLYSTDSTNTYLGRLIEKKDLKEGLVVVSETQTNGKGLNLNKWESEPHKNLLFSVLLKPEYLQPQEQFALTTFVSLATFDFIKKKLPKANVSIKWTNDIYVDNMKIAGILINNTIVGTSISHAIIGIGININQTVFKSKAKNPVSLKQISGKDYNLNECLQDILLCLNQRFQDFVRGYQEKLREEYFAHQYKLKGFHPFSYQGKKVNAKILEIDDFGRLIVKTEKNDLLICQHGDIEYLEE